jgi:hypothetical protein
MPIPIKVSAISANQRFIYRQDARIDSSISNLRVEKNKGKSMVIAPARKRDDENSIVPLLFMDGSVSFWVFHTTQPATYKAKELIPKINMLFMPPAGVVSPKTAIKLRIYAKIRVKESINPPTTKQNPITVVRNLILRKCLTMLFIFFKRL